ncbi:hypothetical protein [Tardiphaga sp.]|jgi:hypothetical protein|uniref:hypothetical protein n=1 Tax=Tardiphaga sp. TaxID=1926292 RepID=UPI0037DA120C
MGKRGIQLILATIVMAVAINVVSWGPPNFDKLEKWQTLMAGCLAIIAACIAYWGSSSQARLNERLHREELARRKLALFLKMDFACRLLADRAREIDAQTTFSPIDERQHFSHDDFEIEEPPEIDESWSHLDLFPRPIIAEIRTVRNDIRRLRYFLISIRDAAYYWDPAQDEAPFPFDRVNELASNLWQAAEAIAETLRPMITELAPEMDESTRFQLVYGLPPDGDY